MQLLVDQMRCGTFLKPILQLHSSSTGDRFGATVAEDELMQATLSEDPALQWDLWSPGFGGSLTGGPSSALSRSNRVDLSRMADSRVSYRGFANLEDRIGGGNYVFVTALPLVPKVCEIRSHFQNLRFPVCGILHSVWGADSPAIYMWLLASMRQCDVVVATSQSGETAIRRIFEAAQASLSARVPCPNVVRLPFGTSPPVEDVLDKQRARALLRIPRDSFVLLYLGRFSEEYKADLEIVLQAHARLDFGTPKFRLILAGQVLDQAYLRNLRGRLNELAIADRTIIVENFPDVLKSTIYSACDAFISPVDSIQETFGLSILEAMAHRVPVIASAWSGYRDLVVDGETGFLLRTVWSREAAEALSPFVTAMTAHEVSHYLAQRTVIDVDELTAKIKVLAADPRLAERLGYQARQRILQSYQWCDVAKQFLSLWQDMIEGAQGTECRRPAFVDLNKFFGHYAGAFLSADDRLGLAAGAEGRVRQPAMSWSFAAPSDAKSMESILDRIREKPIKIEELLSKGCNLDHILWLSKKGICKLLTYREA